MASERCFSVFFAASFLFWSGKFDGPVLPHRGRHIKEGLLMKVTLLFLMPSLPQLGILVVLFLVFFGSNKIPMLFKGLGGFKGNLKKGYDEAKNGKDSEP